MTFFDVLQFVALIAGAMLGFRAGSSLGGPVGGGIGLIAGIAIGWIVGRLPFAVSLWSVRRSLKLAATPELRARLEGEYFLSHLLIAELLRRGEPVESFRSVVADQLTSPSADVQRFGRANARLWFPELAAEETREQE